MNVLITGAGNVGRHLAHILAREGHAVTLIDQDPAALGHSRKEERVVEVRGDACEPEVLERAGIRAADVVVAATGDDEDNLVVANLAKFEFQVPQVVARIKNAENAWLYEPDIGVDVAVSAPHIMAQLIEERVALGDVIRLLRLEQGRIVLVEATLPEGSPVAGKKVRDVPWPADAVLLAVIRDTHVIRAGLDTVIQAGDQVIAIADAGQVQALHRVLGTPPPRHH